jgi:hypothetical protein
MKLTGPWRKSSYSETITDDCVEVAGVVGGIAVRDSKDPQGVVLVLPRRQWEDLLTRCRSSRRL